MKKTLVTLFLCTAGLSRAVILNESHPEINLGESGCYIPDDYQNVQVLNSVISGTSLRLEQSVVEGGTGQVDINGSYLISALSGHQNVMFAEGTQASGGITVHTLSSSVRDSHQIVVQNSTGVVLEMANGAKLEGGKLGNHKFAGYNITHTDPVTGVTVKLFGQRVDAISIGADDTATLKNLVAEVDYAIDMNDATLILDDTTLKMGAGVARTDSASFMVTGTNDSICIETVKDAMRELGLEKRPIVNGTIKGTGSLSNATMQGGRLEIGHAGSNGLGQLKITDVETYNTTWHFNICTEGTFALNGANVVATGKFSQLKVERHGNYGENVTISIGYVENDGTSGDKQNMQTFQRGASITLIDVSEGTVHGSFVFDAEQLPAVEEGMVWYTYDLFKTGTIYVVDNMWAAISITTGDELIPQAELETILTENQLADASRIANTMTTAARTTASFGNSALAHADDYRARHSNIWFSTYYSSLDRNSTGRRTGYKSTTTGYAVGLDTLVRKYDAIVGLALGKSNGKITPDRGNHTYTAGTIDQDGVQIGLYGRINQVQPAFHEHSVNAEAYITYGQYDCCSRRKGRGNVETVTACWDENAWALGVRISRNYWWRHGIIITPYAGLEYTMADMDNMREMGYTAVDYACVRAHRQLEILAGLRAQRTLQLRNGQKFIPYASAGLGFDLLRQNAKVSASSAAGTFSDEAASPGKVSLQLQLGTDWFISRRWNAAAGYTFEIRDAAVDHHLQISASRSF